MNETILKRISKGFGLANFMWGEHNPTEMIKDIISGKDSGIPYLDEANGNPMGVIRALRLRCGDILKSIPSGESKTITLVTIYLSDNVPVAQYWIMNISPVEKYSEKVSYEVA